MFNPDEDNVLKTMVEVCNLYPGKILVFGGSIVHPQILGLPRARKYSKDTDFFVPDESVLRLIGKKYKLDEMEGTSYSIINGLYAFFFVGRIKDLELQESQYSPQVFNTSKGTVYTLPLELIAALKFRRGITRAAQGLPTRKGTVIYGKDVYDVSALLSVSHDPRSFGNYMMMYTCPSCELNVPYACIHDFLKHPAIGSLPKNYERGAEIVCNSINLISCRYSI